MNIRARQRAVTVSNVKSGWRATGLAPLSPIEVLRRVEQPERLVQTSQAPGDGHDFELSLLKSSPPDSTELRRSNDLLRSELRENTALLSPARRYNERALTLGEMALSDNIILRKRFADTESLLSARKQRKNGRRISLKDKYVFSTQEVLDIAREAESQASNRKVRRSHDKAIQSRKSDTKDEEDVKNALSDNESDCIVVASSKSF